MRRVPTLRRGLAAPLADLPRIHVPAQRTAAVRLLLAVALAGTLVWLFFVAQDAGAGRAAVFPEGTSTGVVALDMSASISGPIYARVATTLRGIVNANQSVGLIMYSDTAYELIPPNSPPAAMLQFIPFFVPQRYYGSTPVFGQTPWDTFMGGTRIAGGLKMARLALRRAHVKHGAILLVSDLDDSNADQGLLEDEALKLRTAHVPVRIVPLYAQPRDRRLFGALFGENAFVDPSVFTHTARRHAASIAAPQPWMLILLGGLLVVLLAGNERFNARLTAKGATA
jgi:von Willebrand factor type A domain